MARFLTLFSLAVLAPGAAGIAHAQVVRGQVIETTSGTSVGGGFVVLVGMDGKEVARTLADQRGAFVIRAPVPGQYRIRSERIGFRVALSAPFTLVADEIRAQ